jgi:hypothetical protein
MADKKPDPKPPAGAPEIPVGKLVGARGDKPVAKPKAKPIDVPPVPVAAPVAPPAVPAFAPSEFDVELVAIPCAPPKPVTPREKRSLFLLDRRDFFMLGAGASATVAAAVLGLIAAKALQTKPTDTKSGEPEPKSKSESNTEPNTGGDSPPAPPITKTGVEKVNKSASSTKSSAKAGG